MGHLRNGSISCVHHLLWTAPVPHLHSAMAQWESAACVDFVPYDSNDDDHLEWIRVQEGNSCSATVGVAGGEQPVTLNVKCDLGRIVHELGHSLGLHHTQRRWDRDTWITYHEANVLASQRDEYEKAPEYLALGAYDYGSIMHYDPYTFNNDNGATMSAPEPIGQRNGPSPGDVQVCLHLECRLGDDCRWQRRFVGASRSVGGQCSATRKGLLKGGVGRPFAATVG